MTQSSHPPIRSFVLRQGRVSNAQRRAVDTLLPAYGIAYSPGALDLERAFGRRARTILEIGFGMGETTALIAKAHPENNYLGIEVHTPGVGGLLKLIAEGGLANVRIIQHDAVEVLEHMIAPAALAGAHVFFPDPWPKKRHHKRRLIQPAFVSLLASRLAPGAYLHAATDWQEYAEQILAVFAAEPALANTAPGFAPRPDYRPLTKFESRGLKLGHGVWDIIFCKTQEL
jgi:tRNA (guanine-N7-)-methyltransferase